MCRVELTELNPLQMPRFTSWGFLDSQPNQQNNNIGKEIVETPGTPEFEVDPLSMWVVEI